MRAYPESLPKDVPVRLRRYWPGGELGSILRRLYDSHDRRPAAFYRALRRVPKGSPVYGVPTLSVLDSRFSHLAGQVALDELTEDDEEFAAINAALSVSSRARIITGLFLQHRRRARYNRLLKTITHFINEQSSRD